MSDIANLPTIRPTLEQIADDFSKDLSNLYEKIKIRVFLCGAGIDPEGGPPEGPPAKLVRYNIYNRLIQEGCETLLGEHEALRRAAEGVLRAGFTLADFELELAEQKKTDLIIIFPSSEGSFAELGMFAINDVIPLKMVVLVENNPMYFEGYVYQGPVMAARNRRAHIEHCNYEDLDEVWSIIERHIQNQKVLKRGRKRGVEY